MMRVEQGRTFMGRFSFLGDLLGELDSFCRKEKILLGTFSIIGALKNVKLGYYHQEEKKYVTCVDLKKTLEITSCTGNISLLEDQIFVHAHITLADHEGHCFGGHLMPGSKLFAAEYIIQEFVGGEMKRTLDEETGLNLWTP